MDLILGCAICGGDAATNTMLVNVAIAGGLSVPFFFRDQVVSRVRRWRGLRPDEADTCPISPVEDEAPEA